MKDVLDDIDRWRADGHRIAVARVVGTEGSGPREAGATMAVNDAGEVAGSVSGGCVEGAVVTEALRVLDGTRERGVITFGYSDDEAFAVGGEVLGVEADRGDLADSVELFALAHSQALTLGDVDGEPVEAGLGDRRSARRGCDCCGVEVDHQGSVTAASGAEHRDEAVEVLRG